jgi:hypothetical protein
MRGEDKAHGGGTGGEYWSQTTPLLEIAVTLGKK